jgi:hypothetical protein
MKETTQAKITASVAIAKAMAQKALSPNPNPQWTEYEMRSIDESIARQGVKLDRPEAIRLVEIGAKGEGEIVVTWLNSAATGGRHKRMTSFEEWRKRTPAPK